MLIADEIRWAATLPVTSQQLLVPGQLKKTRTGSPLGQLNFRVKTCLGFRIYTQSQENCGLLYPKGRGSPDLSIPSQARTHQTVGLLLKTGTTKCIWSPHACPFTPRAGLGRASTLGPQSLLEQRRAIPLSKKKNDYTRQTHPWYSTE